LTEESLLLQGV